MNAREYQQAIIAFKPKIGPEAWISTHISDAPEWGVPEGEGVIRVTVHPQGVLGSSSLAFAVHADDFDKAFAALQAKWVEYAATHAKRMVKQMALEIIRITNEVGHCTDAALRQKFHSTEVNLYGKDACVEADVMADKGPFTILTLGGANGAPIEADPPTQTKQ